MDEGRSEEESAGLVDEGVGDVGVTVEGVVEGGGEEGEC